MKRGEKNPKKKHTRTGDGEEKKDTCTRKWERGGDTRFEFFLCKLKKKSRSPSAWAVKITDCGSAREDKTQEANANTCALTCAAPLGGEAWRAVRRV